MLKHWKSTLFFIHCLLFFLVVNLPLALLLERVELPPHLKIYQPDGTLFRGGAGQLTINQVTVQNVEFAWQANCLLSLQWCYRVNTPQGEATVGVGPLAPDISLTHVDVAYPSEELAAFIPNLLVQPTGTVRLRSDKLVLVDQKPQAIDATLTWSGLGVADGSESLVLGDYLATISGGGDQLAWLFD